MIETQEALGIALVVLLPGAIASRVWRHTARFRAAGNEQDRVTSLLVWSAVHAGLVLLTVWRVLQPALSRAAEGTASYGDLTGVAGALVVSPWILGRLAGAAFMKWPGLFRDLGLVGPQGKTSWDWLGGGGRCLQIPFVIDGVEYVGEVEHSDADGDEIYLVGILESRSDGWTPVADRSGVLMIKKGERYIWIREMRATDGRLHQYRTQDSLWRKVGRPPPDDGPPTAAAT